jgi:Uma2 family endonuclease
MAKQPGGRTGLTYDDLVEMFVGEPDNVIRELIDGELFVSPSPGKRHQRAVLQIVVALHAFAEQTGGQVYPAPMDVRFSDRDVLEPDVIYIGPGKDDLSEDRFLRAIDLAVEVSSHTTLRHDLVRKRRVFEQFGVPEFWFVNLEAERVDVYRLKGAVFGSPTFAMRGERLTSPLLPGLELDVDEILGSPPTA